MRSSKSRSRSKQNRPRTLGNIINRVFDSSGPEGKVRGTPQQIIDKYQQLARDAQLSNDRVAAENFLQHAEHYTRLLAEATREMAAEQEARQQSQQQNGNSQQGGAQQSGGYQRDRNDRSDYRSDYRSEQPAEAGGHAPTAEGFDVVGGDEASLVDLPEAPRQRDLRRDEPRRDDRARDDRAREPRRDDRARDDRPRDDRPREDRPRYERPKDERPRDEPRRDEQRQETRRDERPREDRPREPRPRAADTQAELPSFITRAPASDAPVPAQTLAEPRAEKPVKPAAAPTRAPARVQAKPAAPNDLAAADNEPTKPVRVTRPRKPAAAKPPTNAEASDVAD